MTATTATRRRKTPAPTGATLPPIPGAPSALSGRARDRAVEAARQLFFEQGYASTSLAQILERAQLNPGSLYYHFRSKEDLLVAVLQRYLEMLGPFVMDPAASAAPDARGRVAALMGGYREQLIKSQFRLGCPIGSLALEVSPAFPEARALVEKNFAAWKDRVRAWLEESGLAAAQAAPLAEHILAVMEGAVMLARARQDIAPYDAAVAALMSHLGRELDTEPVSTGGRPSARRIK